MKIAAILSFVFLFLTQAYAQGVKFEESNWEEFRLKNKREKQFYYVKFYTHWCGYCRLMDRTTFADEQVAQYTASYYKAFKVNAEGPSGKDIAYNFKVKGYPTTLFFNPEGEEIFRLSGYSKPDDFLKVLQDVQKKYELDQKESISNIQTNPQLDLWFSEKVMNNEKSLFTAKPCYEKALESASQTSALGFEASSSEDCKDEQLFYAFGKGDKDKVQEGVDKMISEMKFETAVLEYFVLHFLARGETGSYLVKWVNTLNYAQPNYEHMLLKSYAYYLDGSKSDAKSALKTAKKMRVKGQDASVLEKELKKVL